MGVRTDILLALMFSILLLIIIIVAVAVVVVLVVVAGVGVITRSKSSVKSVHVTCKSPLRPVWLN